MVCFATNKYPGSSLAAAATLSRGGFRVKWDILHVSYFFI
jgi:hypothetical protein